MIDAHHHLWDLDAVHYPWLMAKGVERFFGDPTPIQRDFPIDEFRGMASASGFRASVHIQVGAEDGYAEAEWVDRVAGANPDWPMAQVAFADLASPRLGADLDRLQTLPTVRGIRQIVGRAPGEDAKTGSNDLLANPLFMEGLAELGRRGLTFDLQLIPELMEAAAALLGRVPDLRAALCHAGSPHDRSTGGLKEWAGRLRALSELPGVVCKLSGLGMFQHDWREEDFRPIVETCLEQFGPENCMFGSNFPVDSLYSDYRRLASALLSIVPENCHDDVFHRTAARFYSIDC